MENHVYVYCACPRAICTAFRLLTTLSRVPCFWCIKNPDAIAASGTFLEQAQFIPAERERSLPYAAKACDLPESDFFALWRGRARSIRPSSSKTRGFAFFAYTQTVFISQIARLSDILRVNYRAYRTQPHASTHILCNQLY